jgi:Flp pilus assembly protein TadB
MEKEQLEQIGKYVKDHLGEWIEDVRPDPVREREVAVLERIVRVEEELKSQRELMLQGFDQMEKRFEQVDKRLEAHDKRFDELTAALRRFIYWSFGTTVTIAGVIIAVITLT